MDTVHIHVQGGTDSDIERGRPLSDILGTVKNSKAVVAFKADGACIDISTPAECDMSVEPVYVDSAEGLDIFRHSASHVMADAVLSLFPNVKITIGPAVVDGFYYDFDYDGTFTPEDLPEIEKKMKEIISSNQPFERIVMQKDEALSYFRNRNETYKIELLQDLEDETISLYKHGEFTDLCRGPHIPSTGMIRAFKLTSIAGAYWRGDESRKMLQRIYGTAFPDKKQLKEYIHRIEEAKKRDHRKLGRELDLFNIYEEAGAGLIVYHPKGALLRRLLEDFEIREHLDRGYQLVKGPQILKLDLWEKSGHLDNYRENMYFTEIDGKQYGLKPMNCIAHMLIYKSSLHSYKDLPVRYFELGTVNRHEKSGVLHGLSRVREFTQDDAHILCTPGQLQDEIVRILRFVQDVMSIFGFGFDIELSTRPEKSIGNVEDWDRATGALREALDSNSLSYGINEGDGAFYGPKIDFKLKDCLNRSWQCATIQCDFFLPDRFDLSYIGEDGEKHRPVMLHRVILGSIERFLGVLIEHYAGAFPLWLAPVQSRILTITDKHATHAEAVYRQLRDSGVRTETDSRNESLGFKIREAQLQKIPFMLVIGDKEVEGNGVAPRMLNGKNLGFYSVDDFIALVQQTCGEQLHQYGR